MWDVGGQDKIRNLWRHYYANTQGLIFVVDSNDKARLDAAGNELHKMLQEEELREADVLIFANKQGTDLLLVAVDTSPSFPSPLLSTNNHPIPFLITNVNGFRYA